MLENFELIKEKNKSVIIPEKLNTLSISVIDDTIIVTCYNVPKELNLHKHYQNLPEKLSLEGIDPRVPWLCNFKLDFKFK